MGRAGRCCDCAEWATLFFLEQLALDKVEGYSANFCAEGIT